MRATFPDLVRGALNVERMLAEGRQHAAAWEQEIDTDLYLEWFFARNYPPKDGMEFEGCDDQ